MTLQFFSLPPRLRKLRFSLARPVRARTTKTTASMKTHLLNKTMIDPKAWSRTFGAAITIFFSSWNGYILGRENIRRFFHVSESASGQQHRRSVFLGYAGPRRPSVTDNLYSPWRVQSQFSKGGSEFSELPKNSFRIVSIRNDQRNYWSSFMGQHAANLALNLQRWPEQPNTATRSTPCTRQLPYLQFI